MFYLIIFPIYFIYLIGTLRHILRKPEKAQKETCEDPQASCMHLYGQRKNQYELDLNSTLVIDGEKVGQ